MNRDWVLFHLPEARDEFTKTIARFVNSRVRLVLQGVWQEHVENRTAEARRVPNCEVSLFVRPTNGTPHLEQISDVLDARVRSLLSELAKLVLGYLASKTERSCEHRVIGPCRL